MEIKFQDRPPERIKTALLAFPVREKRLDDPALRRLDRLLGGRLAERIKKSQFTGAEAAALSYGTAGKKGAADPFPYGARETPGSRARPAGPRRPPARGKKPPPSAPRSSCFSSRRKKTRRPPRRRSPRAHCSPRTSSTNTAPTANRAPKCAR